MNTSNRTPAPPASSGMSVTDVLYILYRHKLKIIGCTLLGLLAAAGFYFSQPPLYQSQAKLLVRYVVERSAVDPVAETADGPVMDSELAILVSWDLALQVAETVGPANLYPDAPDITRELAAAGILENLEVTSGHKSNVIEVAYAHPNPALTQHVLNELVRAYFDKHLAVHRSVGAFDFVSQQTDEVRARLRETEAELRKLKSSAGILSVEGSTTAMTDLVSYTQQELLTAEAALAEQKARVNDLSGPSANASSEQQSAPAARIDASVAMRYQALVARLAVLRETQFKLLERYTPASPMVRRNVNEVASLEAQRGQMERTHPDLASTAAATTNNNLIRLDPAAERANLAAAEARVAALQEQLSSLADRSSQFSESSAMINQLERKREIEEENFKYFESSLERARVDEALDPAKMPNISIVQAPSPAMMLIGQKQKIALALAGGGLALGLLIAFAIELLLDRSVRRPYELETRLNIPQLLSIPFFSGGDRALALKRNTRRGDTSGDASVPPWVGSHFMKQFSDAIRDRLIHTFQIEDVKHTPKLIGVTGSDQGNGTTTLACSLAASFSQTGDGKVLLVDACSPTATAHPFFEGKPAHSLEAALGGQAKGALPSAEDNLYIATVFDPNGSGGGLMPNILSKMMTQFRASEFDYIIFDMPPVTQTSPTLTLAGYMDKTLYVVEAARSDRDVVRRGYDKLIAGKASVLGILNKARSNTPDWIEAHA